MHNLGVKETQVTMGRGGGLLDTVTIEKAGDCKRDQCPFKKICDRDNGTVTLLFKHGVTSDTIEEVKQAPCV